MKKSRIEIILRGDAECVENNLDMIMDSLFAFGLSQCEVFIQNEDLKNDA